MSVADSGSKAQDMSTILKNWVMVTLTLLFVLLYGAALTGWLKPLADEKMVIRLEPIIFVIIGYYFGRLPAQQNEKTLKEEISRQTQKAEAAQHAKEQTQQAREALEEKLKNVRATLALASPSAPLKALTNSVDKADAHHDAGALRYAMATALNILNS